MRQRWLMDNTGNVVTLTKDEYGNPGNATVGRGLNLTGFAVGAQNGRFTVSFDPGASVVDLVSATATVTAYNSVIQYCVVSEQLTSTGATFQLWGTTTGPGSSATKQLPPNSNFGSISTPFALGTAPVVSITSNLSTTFARVPVTLTGTGSPITGLTMTIVTNATSSVLATAMVAGESYTITSVGTTNFTLYGASANVIGTQFTCTSVGLGTGTVNKATILSASFDQDTNTVVSILGTGAPGAVTAYTVGTPANFASVIGTGTVSGLPAGTAVCGPAASFGTVSITQNSPVYVSVNFEFTNSTVPA